VVTPIAIASGRCAMQNEWAGG
jgi:hypothetical protein